MNVLGITAYGCNEGKTTSIVSLSEALARRGRRVLTVLFETDTYKWLAREKAHRSEEEALMGAQVARRVIESPSDLPTPLRNRRKQRDGRVDALQIPYKVGGTDRDADHVFSYLTSLVADAPLLDGISPPDYCLIELSNSGSLMPGGMMVSDAVLIVARAFRGRERVGEGSVTDRVQKVLSVASDYPYIDTESTNFGATVTRVPDGAKVPEDDDLSTRFWHAEHGGIALRTSIRESEGIRAAQAQGKPPGQHRAECKAVHDYDDLTEEVLSLLL